MATATKLPVLAGQATEETAEFVRRFAEREGVTMSRAVGMLLAQVAGCPAPPPDRRYAKHKSRRPTGA